MTGWYYPLTTNSFDSSKDPRENNTTAFAPKSPALDNNLAGFFSKDAISVQG
jgi:hypothetical protein